ncbi:MAG: hypothetical protein WB239_05735, partial [Acidimicrobiia bacterium]
MQLPRAPLRSDIDVTSVGILMDQSDCLVAVSVLDLESWRGDGATREGVDVLWRQGSGWRFATHWTNENDQWEADCEGIRVGELP